MCLKHIGCVGTARGLTEARAKYRGAALGRGARGRWGKGEAKGGRKGRGEGEG